MPLLYLTGPCPSCDPCCVRTPQSPAISVVPWFGDPAILTSWVCQSSWASSCLWVPEILVWPIFWGLGILWFCDPVILGMLEYLGVELLLGVMGPVSEFTPKVNQPRLEGRVPVSLDPTGSSYTLWCWDRLIVEILKKGMNKSFKEIQENTV